MLSYRRNSISRKVFFAITMLSTWYSIMLPDCNLTQCKKWWDIDCIRLNQIRWKLVGIPSVCYVVPSK